MSVIRAIIGSPFLFLAALFFAVWATIATEEQTKRVLYTLELILSELET